jgi:hypothetical protein
VALAVTVPTTAAVSSPSARPVPATHQVPGTAARSREYTILNAVSCVGPADCVAVGNSYLTSGYRELVAHWGGDADWTQLTSPPGPSFGSGLTSGVSCWGASGCMTTDQVGFGASGTATPEVWNGISWTQLDPPMPNTAYRELTAVDCYAQAACLLIGGAGGERPLALSWADGAWQLERVVPRGGFAGVACTATGGCVAAGGSSWRLIRTIPTPIPHDFAQLSDVSCVSARFCVVAGAMHPRKGPFTSFADLWNGSSFRLLKVPGNGLTSISCLSTAFCMAVTVHSAVIWNGSFWRVRSLPGFPGRPGLVAVSCASERQCMAVGNYVTSSGSGNTVLLLSGRTWRVLPSPAPGTVLTDVSCAGAAPCVVVGESYDGAAATQTFAAEWSTGSWLVDPTPNP